ncbi:hypothetical protein B9Y74_05510 [Stenotrophomonas maltophilia]|nr:hypothetical protein B9Y74_05510 [Stenotrophomonas maltophilia]
MADGAEQRLDAQIAEALFGQPGMSKMDVANRVRELRGDGPALLVGGQPDGSPGLGAGSPMAKMAAALRGKAEAEWAAFDQRVQSGEWGPMPDNPDVLELPPLPEEVDSVRCMIRGEKGFAEPCDYYFTAKQMRDYARAALSAQPSPGGQDALRALVSEWRERAEELSADDAIGLTHQLKLRDCADELEAAISSEKERS